MKDVAHIWFEGGSCFLPAQTPYDCELLFDFLNQSANRHGYTRVDLNQQDWTVTRADGDRHRCASCRGQLRGLTYVHGKRALCPHCARREMI